MFMRITVDIPEKILKELLQITGESKKSPAIAKAVEEFLRQSRSREFGRLIRESAFDYPYTNEQIEEADV
jgi:metal-responsive CopG/Arc/MetJ family transcriptional regulator